MSTFSVIYLERLKTYSNGNWDDLIKKDGKDSYTYSQIHLHQCYSNLCVPRFLLWILKFCTSIHILKAHIMIYKLVHDSFILQIALRQALFVMPALNLRVEIQQWG